jgi:RND family efflux transporter MFP subunit
MKHMKTFFLIAVLFGLIFFAYCTNTPDQDQDTSGAEKPPLAVEGIRVGHGTLKGEIHASGLVKGIREVSVVSETQGTITAVNFALGQKVEKGTVLVEVDDRVQRALFKQARAAVSAAELHLQVTEKLFEEGDASDAELTAARSQASAAYAQLESARKAYGDCKILTPISGYIARKGNDVEPGNFLAPGTAVTRVVDLRTLKTTAAVGEREIGLLKAGMPALLRIPAAGNIPVEGAVTAVGAGSDPYTGSYPVEVSWKNTADGMVKSGMSVELTIETDKMESVILIPFRAIVEKEGKNAVFVVRDDRVAIRFVETGRMKEENVEIVNGLKPGEVLLTTGITSLMRGDRVEVTIVDGKGGDK